VDKMHSLLRRQLKRYVDDGRVIPDRWHGFIGAVNDAYRQMDRDREMLERSLELSSQELLQANAEMRAVFHAFPDLLFQTDLTGRILDYQAAGSADFRFDKEKAIGRQICEIFPAGIGKTFGEAIAQIRKTGTMASLEYDLPGPDGGKACEARLLLMREGKIIIIVRDITERKRAVELYKTLADSSQAGVFIVQDGRFIFANPHIMKYSGHSERELLGNYSLAIVHPEDRALLRESAIDMLKGRRTNPYEYRIIDRTRQTRRLIETVRSITYGGRRAILGNTMDITQRYEMERVIRQAQKMDSIGTLAGGIAHDFNNILHAVMGYTDMALAVPHLDDRLRSYLGHINKAGERARDLVKQILTFSRQKEQERRPILIAPIVKEGVKLLKSSLPATIRINLSIGDGSTMVLADPTQIHQVVVNLCTNAAHAMREKGGVLDIRLDDESVSASEAQHPLDLAEGDYVKLTVRDTGTGIDPAIIDRIFDPFFTTKGPDGGTGLGLSIVYGIVRDYGGGVDVASEPGRGTTVTAYIPLIENGELPAALKSDPIPGGKERILFVDDEAELVELGSVMLDSLGYQTAVRTSSIEALEAFMAGPYRYDLVITDMTMPNMRGDQLAAEILKVRPDMPIILCTGFSEMISEAKARNIGLRRLIMKPLGKRDLARAVRDVLDEPSRMDCTPKKQGMPPPDMLRS